MADFASLATSYVLADDEDEQRRLAGQAADGKIRTGAEAGRENVL